MMQVQNIDLRGVGECGTDDVSTEHRPAWGGVCSTEDTGSVVGRSLPTVRVWLGPSLAAGLWVLQAYAYSVGSVALTM